MPYTYQLSKEQIDECVNKVLDDPKLLAKMTELLHHITEKYSNQYSTPQQRWDMLYYVFDTNLRNKIFPEKMPTDSSTYEIRKEVYGKIIGEIRKDEKRKEDYKIHVEKKGNSYLVTISNPAFEKGAHTITVKDSSDEAVVKGILPIKKTNDNQYIKKDFGFLIEEIKNAVNEANKDYEIIKKYSITKIKKTKDEHGDDIYLIAIKGTKNIINLMVDASSSIYKSIVEQLKESGIPKDEAAIVAEYIENKILKEEKISANLGNITLSKPRA